MNLVNAFVTEVIQEPIYTRYGWEVRVKYDSYGNEATTELYFKTQKEALGVKAGYEFLT